MNIREVLNDSRCDLLAAEILLAFVLNKDREHLISHSDEELLEEDYRAFSQLLDRHLNGEPVAYLINKKEFFGIDLFVDERVLIPRPETELLVDRIIEFVQNNADFEKEVSILDVGTGSGNMPIALALHLPQAKITATDISEDALLVAKKNIDKYLVQDRIRLIHSDLLEELSTKKFDIIVANLPYIGTEKNNFISKEVAQFEPHTALYGGNNGLKLYEKLFDHVREHRNCRTCLLGEIGFSQKSKLEELGKQYFPDHNLEVLQDLAGLDRYFIVNYK